MYMYSTIIIMMNNKFTVQVYSNLQLESLSLFDTDCLYVGLGYDYHCRLIEWEEGLTVGGCTE